MKRQKLEIYNILERNNSLIRIDEEKGVVLPSLNRNQLSTNKGNIVHFDEINEDSMTLKSFSRKQSLNVYLSPNESLKQRIDIVERTATNSYRMQMVERIRNAETISREFETEPSKMMISDQSLQRLESFKIGTSETGRSKFYKKGKSSILKLPNLVGKNMEEYRVKQLTSLDGHNTPFRAKLMMQTPSLESKINFDPFVKRVKDFNSPAVSKQGHMIVNFSSKLLENEKPDKNVIQNLLSANRPSKLQLVTGKRNPTSNEIESTQVSIQPPSVVDAKRVVESDKMKICCKVPKQARIKKQSNQVLMHHFFQATKSVDIPKPKFTAPNLSPKTSSKLGGSSSPTFQRWNKDYENSKEEKQLITKLVTLSQIDREQKSQEIESTGKFEAETKALLSRVSGSEKVEKESNVTVVLSPNQIHRTEPDSPEQKISLKIEATHHSDAQLEHSPIMEIDEDEDKYSSIKDGSESDYQDQAKAESLDTPIKIEQKSQIFQQPEPVISNGNVQIEVSKQATPDEIDKSFKKEIAVPALHMFNGRKPLKPKNYVLMVSPSKRLHIQNKKHNLSQEELEKRSRSAYFMKLVRMSKEDRIKEFKNLTQKWIDQPKYTPEQKAKIEAFMNKLHGEYKFPFETLKKMVDDQIEIFNKEGVKLPPDFLKQLIKDEQFQGLLDMIQAQKVLDEEEEPLPNTNPYSDTSQYDPPRQALYEKMKTIQKYGKEDDKDVQLPVDITRGIDFQSIIQLQQQNGDQEQRTTSDFVRSNTDETQYSLLQTPINNGNTQGEWFKSELYTNVLNGLVDKGKLNRRQQGVHDFARDIALKDQMSKVQKFAHEPLMIHNLKTNPVMNYIENCQQEFVLTLPILNKIKNKQLILQNYPLNSGVTASLGKALQINTTLVEKIILENNNLTDQDMFEIFTGLTCQQCMKQIVIKQNEIGEKCLVPLQKMIKRRSPDNIEELILIDCKISTGATTKLMEILTNQKSFLRKLSLVKCNFNSESTKLLHQYVKSTKNLEHLDISYNAFTQSEMFGLLEILSMNRKLISLDLTMNQLWDGKAQIPARPQTKQHVRVIETQGEEGEDVEEGEDAEKEKKSKAPPKPSPHELQRVEVLSCLQKFIKYNTNLQHLNLTQTGLDYEILYGIADGAITKARSLLSLHMSDNPGITPGLIQFLKQRIKAFDTTPIQLQLLESSFEDRETKSQKIEEYFKLKQIKESYKIQHFKIENPGILHQPLMISRFLGHQEEMLESGRWKVTCEHEMMQPENHGVHYYGEGQDHACWICDQQIYSLVFWNINKGQSKNRLKPGAAKKFVQNLTEQIPLLDPIPQGDDLNSRLDFRRRELYTLYLQDAHRPLICGKFTEWKPMRMIRIDEFAKALERQSNFMNFWKNIFGKLADPNFVPETLGQSKQAVDPKKRDKELEDLMRTYKISWTEILIDYIKYKRPQLINIEAMQDPYMAQADNELYVFPCFIQPGKLTYSIIQQNDLANQEQAVQMPTDVKSYQFYKEIVDNRDEEIPGFFKKLTSKQKERLFDHAKSVFKEWKPDNEATLSKCLEHDFKYWKVENFCKDPAECERVKELTTQYFEKVIKKQFHYLMAKSQYPGIGWQDYSQYAATIKIPDERMLKTQIDTCFTAANVQIVKIEGNDNNESSLCRFQFLEILVRLAKAKFLETKIEKSQAVALERLIKEHMIPLDPTEEWQGFRDKELWTIEVNDMMEPNIPGLLKVYEAHFAPRKKGMDMKDAIEMFTKRTDIIALEKDVIYCVGMSKMTYSWETNHQDTYYNQLKFVEFLELLGRIAAFKYSGPQYAKMTLVQKMEPILDDVLALKGLKRIEPEIVLVDESESDRDY